MTVPVIHLVTTLDLKVQPWAWPFARERRDDIDAYFESMRIGKPQLWNGRVLLARHPVFSGERFSAGFFETDFASFLAWRDWGFPDKDVFNSFGMGALRSADGAFVLGEMSQHTANAGRVYFAAGTPDLDDISHGEVDIAGSVAREVEEETGLTQSDYRADEHWHGVAVGSSIALMRILTADRPSEQLRAAIKANLAAQAEPELSDVYLVRGIGDLTETMPRFVTAFLEAQFSPSWSS